MKNNEKNCPICPRGCDLRAPHCARGAEYAKTGKLPQGAGHGEHPHGGAPRLRFENEDEQLIMKYLHHAVGAADRGGITQQQAGEMFSVLSGEETHLLRQLLEKLSDHWLELAPNKGHH